MHWPGRRQSGNVQDRRGSRGKRVAVVPNAFTHGMSEQRMRWFCKGLETGDLSQGNTFSATSL